jgi:hypothetical protein
MNKNNNKNTDNHFLAAPIYSNHKYTDLNILKHSSIYNLKSKINKEKKIKK